MKYYRVKKEYDNYWTPVCFLVGNELYTEKEMKKFKILPKCVIECDVKKNQTYWLFGARFCTECGYSD